MEVIEYILREGIPHRVGLTHTELVMNAMGTCMMAIGLLIMGLVSLMGISQTYPPTIAKRLALRFFAWALIFAGLVFVFNFMAHWHNYPFVRGGLKIIVGFHLIGVAFLIPQVLKEQAHFKKLMELEENISTTKKILEEVKEINRKL